MLKCYKKTVEYCNDCPDAKSYVNYWGEFTEWVCKYKVKGKNGMDGRDIAKKSANDKSKTDIPKWCPLDDI